MSTTIKSIYGKAWTVDGSELEDGEVAIDSRGDAGCRLFKMTDLLDALKAEGLLEGEFVKPVAVEMASDGVLRPVKGEPHSMDSPEYHEWSAGLSVSRAAYWRKENARTAEAAAAERELAERRDHIVSRHAGGLSAFRYSDLDVNGKHIVDTIRNLEDQLAKVS